MKNSLLILCAFSLLGSKMYAQVGIGTTSPNSSAVLDLSSTSKGLLIPRMTSSQRTTISSPTKGLLVFDNDSGYFFYYTGSAWSSLKNVSSSSLVNYWSRTGTSTTLANSGDNVGIGKTPSYKLDVSGFTNSDSFGIGGKTVISIKGNSNFMAGQLAGASNSGSDNTFTGYKAGYFNGGASYSSFYGFGAGYKNTGSWNNFFGYEAGQLNTSGTDNNAFGFTAGESTTGSFNVSIGNYAGTSLSGGSDNVIIGYSAGQSTHGPANAFIGSHAGGNNSTGTYNSALGYFAGNGLSAGTGNVMLGNYAGYNYDGNHNTYIGDSSDASVSGLSNATAVGYNAKVGQSNAIVLGNGSANVGIGTTTPNSSALLDLTSTGQGLLVPRMTESQMTSISTPATGLVVYNTDSNYFFFYNSGWKGIKSNSSNVSSQWTNSGSNIYNGNSGNVGIGKSSPSYKLDVSGFTNSDSFGIGGSSMLSSKGTQNLFVGYKAGHVNSGLGNTFIGYGAGIKNTSAIFNTFIGDASGFANTTGNQNTFLGAACGEFNTTGAYNTFLGTISGEVNTNGTNNSFIGYGAGGNNTTGSNNTFIGLNAGAGITSASGTSALGMYAGSNNTGSHNTFLGDSADATVSGIRNATAIGYYATTGASNTLILGNGARVGIGTSAPSAKLEVNGSLKFDTLAGTGTRVLVTDASGNISSQSTSSIGTWTISGSNIYNSNSGKVGIGKTSPAYQLDVVGPVNADSLMLGGSTVLSATAFQSIFIGAGAGVNVDRVYSGSNTFLGYKSGNSNYQGNQNTFLGNVAGYKNVNGGQNNFIGNSAGYNNISGSYNNFIGSYAGYNNTTGTNNLFNGESSGHNTTTGSYNTVNGNFAGYSNTTGYYNNFLGYQAGYNNTTGTGNTAIGNYTGFNYNGNHNTFIGDSADASSSGLSNATAIGYNAKVSASNSLVLGNGANVGIGTSTPNSSALLDLTSTSQGFLIPRMTESQMTAISSPAAGLMIYNTDSAYFFYYNSSWNGIKASASLSNPWATSGSNIYNSNSGNIGIGKSSPSYKLDVSGLTNSDSFGINGSTVLSTKGSKSIFVGLGAGANVDVINSYANTFLGYESGYSNNQGGSNTFLGNVAGYKNNDGTDNNFIGASAGYNNISGSYNNFIGSYAGYNNTTGTNNLFNGASSGHNNTTGSYNTVNGNFAGYSNTTGYYNNFLGYQAGYKNTTGTGNTAIGNYSGFNYNGNHNTFIGDSADASSGLSNATAIGYNAKVSASNALILGNSARIGIGTSSPAAKLEVNGSLKFDTLAGTGSRMVITDANGSLSTQSIPSSTTYTAGTGITISGSTINSTWTTSGSNIYNNNTGNVGIGKSSPGYKLDVSGSINADSLTIGGALTLDIRGSFNFFAGTGTIGGAGSFNTSIGHDAGRKISTGTSNVILGTFAGDYNTSGSGNTFLGYSAGNDNISGQNNTAIGNGANFNFISNLSNATAIGYNAIVSASNALILGNSARIGIGTSSPSAKLEVNGSLKFDTLAGTGTRVLVTDASGNISSQSTSSVCTWTTSGGNIYNNNSGNVGIGKSSPSYKLDVSGAVNADSIYLSGSRIISVKGNENTFLGSGTGVVNSGSSNTFMGYDAGINNTSGSFNLFAGTQAGSANTIGQKNTFNGYQAGFANTTGNQNTITGYKAGLADIAGSNNSFYGFASGLANTAGTGNAAYGQYSGRSITTGYHNTLIGDSADVSTATLTNATAIGYAASVGSNNYVRIGNSSVTSIGGYASWSNVSDRRAKKNITEDVKGLDFIMKLRPVTYNLDIHAINSFYGRKDDDEAGSLAKEKIRYSGFIAQEVEQAAISTGYDFSGVDKPGHDKELYALRYADFVVPVVKGIQELKKENDELKAQMQILIERLEKLEKQR